MNRNFYKAIFLAVFTCSQASAADGVPTTAGAPCQFSETTRYSQLVINSRINDFKANTVQAGFGVYDSKGKLLQQPKMWAFSLDYVPGLVAKAVIEAADYYKDRKDIDVAPWFYAIQYYGCTYDIADNGKNGKSFDDLNAVKLYFKLAEMAASERFPNGSRFTNATTLSTAKKRFATALKGIAKANDTYAIQASTLEGAAGGWYHKASYTNQMWCDGQYMGPALLAQMINEDADYTPVSTDDWDLITRQFTISWRYLWNPETKLLYHAFTADPGGEAAKKWAGISATKGSEIYHSAEYWGRAIGWYFLALVDVLEQMEIAGLSDSENYKTLHTCLEQLAEGIAEKQDAASGCWYQLTNRDASFVAQSYDQSYSYTSQPVANYLESSCTAIFTAAYLKAVRLGMLPKTYLDTARKAYRGFVEQFMVGDGKGGVHLIACCKSAGLGGSNFRDGSAEYYLMGKDTKPTSTKGDDFYTEGKVLGGFILAAIEYERLCDSEATSLKAPVATSSASDTYFSLAGISRSSAGKGIYVRRGKKVVR